MTDFKQIYSTGGLLKTEHNFANVTFFFQWTPQIITNNGLTTWSIVTKLRELRLFSVCICAVEEKTLLRAIAAHGFRQFTRRNVQEHLENIFTGGFINLVLLIRTIIAPQEIPRLKSKLIMCLIYISLKSPFT